MKELNDSVRSHREALFRLLAEDELDLSAVEAEQSRLEQAQQEMGRLVLAHILDMRDKLNPEQRREWLRMMAGHGDRLQTRFGFAPAPSSARRAPFGSPRIPGRSMHQPRRGAGTFRPQGPPAAPRQEEPQ
jgi:hypothetical protein